MTFRATWPCPVHPYSLKMDSKEMKDQAQYIWNRLDDLANSDPSAYKRFIEKQMEEEKVLVSSPESKLCMQTKTMGKDAGKDVFINIFGWQRIPYPETEEEAVKLMAGLHPTGKDVKGKSEVVIPVALNDKVLEECLKEEVDKMQLFSLILTFVQDHCKLNVSHHHKQCQESYRGVLPSDTRSLFMSKSQMSKSLHENTSTSSVNSPEDVLKHLASGGTENLEGAGKIDPKGALDALLGQGEQNKEKGLIQEIISDIPLEDYKDFPKPEHTFVKLAKDERNPERYVLKIHLPSVASVAECDLFFHEDGIELIVEDKFYLSKEFPTPVCDETSSAKFNKKTSHLTITFPIKQAL